MDEATELLRQAVHIGESWFEKDPAHEKLALWRNKLAKSYTHQVRRHKERQAFRGPLCSKLPWCETDSRLRSGDASGEKTLLAYSR